MRNCLSLPTLAAALVQFISAASALEMDWVPVGNPGNADDSTGDGYGSVAYGYSIGKYEVTNAEYAEFLNAVARSDPRGLYSTEMASGNATILRSGSPGSYTYEAVAGREHRPVVYVSWHDALRFANWMHNNCPTGPQGPSTTEDGAYDMLLSSDAVRKAGARVFLPSDDEWYKAAYYDPDKAGGPGYWHYPTRRNTAPTAEDPPGTDAVNGSANYGNVVRHFTDVGAYTSSPSAYGTYDQAGNAAEWVESSVYGWARGIRGGSYLSDGSALHVASHGGTYPVYEMLNTGFRIAAVPEPGTLALFALVAVTPKQRRGKA